MSKQKMKLKLHKCQRQHYKKEMQYKSRIRRLLKAQKPVHTDSNASTDAEFAKSSDDEEELSVIQTYDKVGTTQRSMNVTCNYWPVMLEFTM